MEPNKMTVRAVIISGFAVIALVFVGVYAYLKNSGPADKTAPAQNIQTGTPGGDASKPQKSPTREAPPAGVVVPEKNATDVPAGVAVPHVVSAGNPHDNSSYRSFDLNIQSGAFTPSTVIVREGDTTNINVTAADAAYDFTQPDFGFKVAIKKGETKKIQFGATASGDFLFYCASCGGPSRGPVGHLIITSKAK